VNSLLYFKMLVYIALSLQHSGTTLAHNSKTEGHVIKFIQWNSTFFEVSSNAEGATEKAFKFPIPVS
jgi:hypothetical protein